MQKILDKLSKVRRTRGGYKARCPVPSHNDRTQSLFLRYMKTEDYKTSIQIKCFAGCLTQSIMHSIGLEVSELFNQENMEMTATVQTKEEKGKKYESIEQIKNEFKTLEKAYEYFRLEDLTNPSHLQVRFNTKDGKGFATFHREGDNWYSGKGEKLVPLYNLKEIKNARAVIVVEGEKVVDILKEYGIHATTSIGGSNNAEGTDWTFLMKKESVGMFRDNDDAGLNYQKDVKRILNNLNIDLRCVDVEKYVKEKGDDLEQYIESLDGSNRDQIRFRGVPVGGWKTFGDDIELIYDKFPFEVGDRVAQIYLEKVLDMEFEEVDELEETTRAEGGWGSTGK